MSLHNFLHNNRKTQVLRFVVFMIILIIMIDQFFSMTKFVYNYDNCYDYGDLMKNVCNTNYVEYETSRFHITNNILKLKVDNDNFDNKYDILIVIFTVILSLYILYFFTYLVISSSFNQVVSNYLSGAISTFIPFSILITDSIADASKSVSDMSIIQKIVFLIKVLLIIYLIIVAPVYFVVKYKYNIDLSPYDMTSEKTIIYIVNSFIVAAIIYLKMSNLSVSYVTDGIFVVLTIGSFILMTIVVDIYVTNLNKTENFNREHSQLIAFTNSYSVDVEEIDTNIIVKYISDIIGFNDFTLSPSDYNYKGIILILFIFIIVTLITYYIFTKVSNNVIIQSLFASNQQDADILYYSVFIPFLILLIVMFIVIATKEYNTIINKYILYRPYNLYIRTISKINNIFNQILENDKANVENNSVCKNVANSIHMSLYSSIFFGIHYEDTILYHPINIFVPELEYVSVCDVNDFVPYNKLTQYDFDKTIKIKGENGVFFSDKKCSSVDDKMIINIIKNIVPYYDNVLGENDLIKHKKLLKNLMLFAITNVQNKKTYCGKRGLKITNDFKNNNEVKKIPKKQIDEASEKNLENIQTRELIEFVADEYMKYTLVMYKYIARVVQALCKCNKISDFTNEGYDKWIVKAIHTITTSSGSYSMNIKKSFVAKFTLLTQRFFVKINENMTMRIQLTDDNYKLSKYIIKNYNGYQNETYKFHREKTLRELEYSEPQMSPFEDIENSSNIINNLHNVINDMSVSNADLFREAFAKFSKGIKDLDDSKKIYRDIYTEKYYYNSDYNNEFIFEYKNTYIDSHRTLHDDLRKKIVDHIDDSQNVVPIEFDYNEYNTKYEAINDKYIKSYEALFKLTNDIFKSDADIYHARDLIVEDEVYSRVLQSMSSQASWNIYTIFVIYIVLILTANIVE